MSSQKAEIVIGSTPNSPGNPTREALAHVASLFNMALSENRGPQKPMVCFFGAMH